MNLSALNTGLSQAPINQTPEPSGSGLSTLRLPSSAVSGEDFAAFLRNQVQALQNSQRPNIAAAPAANNLPPAERADTRPARDDLKATDNAQTKSKDKTHARQAQSKDDATDDHEVQQADRSKQDDVALLDTNSKPADSGETENNNLPQTMDSENSVAAQAAADMNASAAAPSENTAAELTTITLSPSVNIITAAKTAPDEKSLSDFALAMGLDPAQVQALFGSSDTLSAKPMNTVSTQQMLAMNTLPTVAATTMPMDLQTNATTTPVESLTQVAVSTADFQALKSETPSQPHAGLGKAVNTLDILNMQVAAGPAQAMTAVSAPPVSTLAVLSMMDSQLRAEDIDALKSEFDAAGTLDLGSSEHGLTTGSAGASGTNSAFASSKAAALVNKPNMAETFDKLSQKLATELAGRMHEKLNAGEWKMKFALKPASLGLVDVQLEMRDGKLTAQFQADSNLTQDLIQNGSQRLKEALGQLGMNNASVFVGQGHSQQQGQTSNQAGNARQGEDNGVKLADESAEETLVQSRPRHSNSLKFDNYA